MCGWWQVALSHHRPTSSLQFIRSYAYRCSCSRSFFPNRRGRCNTQLMTRRPSELSEGRHNLFLGGFFAKCAAICTFPSSYQRNKPSPPGDHSLFVQIFIIVFGTLHCYLSPCFASPTKSVLFRGRDSVLFTKHSQSRAQFLAGYRCSINIC